MSLACPECGARLAGHGAGRCVPLGRGLALLGGLAILAAFLMPWLGVSSPQGSVVLTGEFLGRFLGSTNDLRRFLPGASGEPGEVQALRALVYLFPACGALAALLAIAGVLRPALGRPLDVALGLSGLVPLVALALGVTRLPAATPEAGLRLIGLGAVVVLVGALVGAARASGRT